jgi:hypothetical protein
MIELEIDLGNEKKTYNLPQSWDEVSVDDYVKLTSINNDKLSQVQIVVKNLSVLTGIDEETMYKIPMETFNGLVEYLTFFNQPIDGDLVDYVEIDGDKYYVKKDFDKLTLGETISIDVITEKYEDNFNLAIKELLCIFLRKKVDGKLEEFSNDMMGRVDLFGKISINKIHKLFSFFSVGSHS